MPLEKKEDNNSIDAAEEAMHDRFRRAADARKKMNAAKNRRAMFQKFIQKKIQ